MVDLRLVLLLSCAQAALLGNYRLYNSEGNALYDFSGNGNHGEVSYDADSHPVLTDRGQYFYSKSMMSFPSNMYKLYPSASISMVIAMWFMPVDEGILLRVSNIDSNQLRNIRIRWNRDSGLVKIRFIADDDDEEVDTGLSFSKFYLSTMDVCSLCPYSGSI